MLHGKGEKAIMHNKHGHLFKDYCSLSEFKPIDCTVFYNCMLKDESAIMVSYFYLCLFCTLLPVLALSTETDPWASFIRKKRSLIELAQVVQCSTRLSGVLQILATYNCYGCYCGLGGAGDPVDEIDTCCMIHDKCYATLEQNRTCKPDGEIYFRPYTFACVPDTENVNTSTPICKWSWTGCGTGTCQCDVQFANCLKKYDAKEKKKCPTERQCFGNFK
jgi:secretory phospholipase A2